MDKPLWRGRDRDRDRDLGGACRYSRRLTRLMDKPLWGLRVLKFDGAIAPRVLKFDSGFAAEGCGGRLTFIEGASLYKTFTIGLLPVGKPYNRHAGEEMQSPFGGWRHHLARWEACHWIRGSRGSPMNPVPLPPPQFGGAAKGKRLNGQARRLTSPHLEVLCRTSTGAL